MDNIYCSNCGDLVWCGDGIGYAPGPAAAQIERLHQREQDILAGIQLVVKDSNAGRDKEIQRLNTELESLSLSLDEAKNLINNFTDVSSRLATLVLQMPCKCEESNDGAVDAPCPMCTAYMDWEGVMKRVG